MKNSYDENEEDGDDKFDKMFWRMSVKSRKKYFVSLTTMKTKSFRLTREVLKERKAGKCNHRSATTDLIWLGQTGLN